jgi:hypothetical protein
VPTEPIYEDTFLRRIYIYSCQGLLWRGGPLPAMAVATFVTRLRELPAVRTDWLDYMRLPARVADCAPCRSY